MKEGAQVRTGSTMRPCLQAGLPLLTPTYRPLKGVWTSSSSLSSRSPSGNLSKKKNGEGIPSAGML